MEVCSSIGFLALLTYSHVVVVSLFTSNLENSDEKLAQAVSDGLGVKWVFDAGE